VGVENELVGNDILMMSTGGKWASYCFVASELSGSVVQQVDKFQTSCCCNCGMMLSVVRVIAKH